MKIDEMQDDEYISLFLRNGEQTIGKIMGRTFYEDDEYLVCETNNLDNPICVADVRSLNGQSIPVEDVTARAVVEKFYDENPELANNLFHVTDEEGNDICMELLDFIEYREKAYAVCIPHGDESMEVIILEVHENEEEEEYFSVENEEELNTIFALFKERNAENYDFVD